METYGIKKLKSGTDVRGVASPILGRNVTLTTGAVELIARAFVAWLEKRTGKGRVKIAIGNDSRITADELVAAFERGAMKSGADVIYTGLSSTPSMFMILQSKARAIDGSVMVTASHLPADRNGLKFFTPEGGLEGEDVDEILDIAEWGDFKDGEGTLTRDYFMAEYSAQLADRVRSACGSEKPLDGMKIIVDAGNGAGGFFTELVLKPLGADTTGSLYLEPDGMFPNHIPNPENAAAMDSVRLATIRAKADLGVIFDTDVDRGGAVDARGDELNRNRLVAVASAIALEGNEGGTIVTDSITSSGLKEYIENTLGGRHHRFKRGYRNVINEAIRLNNEGVNCPLAIETSGHAALRENYFLDDGAYLVTRILISLAKLSNEGKDISELIKDLPEPAEAAEVRLTFAEGADFKTLGNGAIEDIKGRAPAMDGLSLAPDNFEGVRIVFGKDAGDGWALVRMSLHEPIMPINFESNKTGGCRQIAKTLLSLLGKYVFLNTENLEKYLAK